jgi:kynurenine formamidase
MHSVHRAPLLLGAGVLIVENLTNLDAIGADLIVLPLELVGRDGSPVRGGGDR